MPRVCSFSRLSLAVLLLAVLGSVAWAKPKVAILGLEAANTGGAVDPKDAQNAAKLTEELRKIPRGGQGKYDFAPNSTRELQDEKLMGNCDTEAPGCMAPIGAGLGADHLIYGRIERVVDKGRDGYKVTIKVLNVKSKKVEGDKTSETFVPIGNFSGGGSLEEWAEKTYAKLSGEKPAPAVPEKVEKDGKLVVTSNIKDAAVFVGGAKKGRLSGGTLTLTLPAGSHDLAIEAPDHKRHEETVTVTGGQTKKVEVELERMLADAPPPPPGGKSGNGTWRVVAWTSVGVALAAGGGLYYSGKKVGDYNAQLCNGERGGCDMSNLPEDQVADLSAKGNRWETTSYAMGVLIGVAAVTAGVGVWRGYFSKSSSGEEKREAGVVGKRKRRDLTVTPVVSPDGGGATVRFDW